MPLIRIDMWEGRDPATKEAIVKRVTTAVAEELGISEKHVWVILDEQPKVNWGIGGTMGPDLNTKD
ncbi:MAG: tautomerase family protein [Actinomycetota bacterium]